MNPRINIQIFAMGDETINSTQYDDTRNCVFDLNRSVTCCNIEMLIVG